MNDIVYKSKLLSTIACAVTRMINKGFLQEVEYRGNLDIFDYKGIAKPLPKYFEEILTDNNCFGMGRTLRKYAGIKTNHINSIIEHGYFFGEYVPIQEQITFAKQILTFGDIRKTHLEAKIKDKRITPIGPYIHYAPLFYDKEEYDRLKEMLGKVLLVFFSHSATGCSVSFDIDYIMSKIEEVRNGFDTVIVSVFWSDITSELVELLEKHNCIVFSAGHRYDYNFLSRQKTVISLADATMSNNIGTHIAYCTYLGKPHWIVRQEISYSSKGGGGQGNIDIVKQIKSDMASAKEKEELMTTFSTFSDVLLEDQKIVASKFFGFNHIKTPEEIKSILSL